MVIITTDLCNALSYLNQHQVPHCLHQSLFPSDVVVDYFRGVERKEDDKKHLLFNARTPSHCKKIDLCYSGKEIRFTLVEL